MANIIIDVYQGSNRKCLAIGNHRISAGKAYGFLEKVESYRCDTKDVLSCIGNGSSWIPCSERLPEHSGIYLAYYTFKDGTHATDIAYINAGHNLGSITHWMPLPEPPEVKQDE